MICLSWIGYIERLRLFKTFPAWGGLRARTAKAFRGGSAFESMKKKTLGAERCLIFDQK